MSDSVDQNYANHVKFVPLFHYVGMPLALLLLVYSSVHAVREPSAESARAVLTAVVIIILFILARTFSLKVQDRVIRLEEQLRLMRLLPVDLQSRIGELSVNQLVALRFASDDELPALTRRVLDERLTSRKMIKQLIKVWRPDTFRV